MGDDDRASIQHRAPEGTVKASVEEKVKRVLPQASSPPYGTAAQNGVGQARSRTDKSTLKELRGGVRRGATECVELAAGDKLVGETEVGDFDVHVSVEEQILRL